MKAFEKWPPITHLFEEMPRNGPFHESGFRRDWGYDRQQYLNFVLDLVLRDQGNLTPEFIGIADTDSPLVAPILPDELFHWDGMKWKPRVLGYTACCVPYSVEGTRFALRDTIEISGEYMIALDFPIIFETSHLKDIRARIVRRVLNQTLTDDLIVGGQFEEAFCIITSSGLQYSQFDSMMQHLWEHNREDYHWILHDQTDTTHPAFSKRMSNSKAVLATSDTRTGVPQIGFTKHPCRRWEPYYRQFVFLASNGDYG